ncbi:MAG: hypothetical protein U0441_22610 [Polyangiaceae bacterium]
MLPERIRATLAPTAGDRLAPLQELGAALHRAGATSLFAAASRGDVKASVYRPYTNVPEKRIPVTEVYADADALWRAIEEGEFGAWDAALDLLVAAGNADVDGLAAGVFDARYSVWPEIGARAKGLLLRSPSDTALDALLRGAAQGQLTTTELADHPNPHLGEKVLEALHASGVTHFAPIAWPSVEAWDTWSPAERKAFTSAREKAAHEAPPMNGILPLTHALVRLAYRPALADLLAMGRGHPATNLRMVALSALQRFDDAEANALLRSLVDDAHAFALGVIVTFRRAPDRAYEVLSRWFTPEALARPKACEVAATILGTLREDATRPPGDPSGPSNGWLKSDPRWLDLVVAHEDDRRLPAALLVHLFDKDDVRAARKRRKASRPATPSVAPADRLARYQAGQHEAVWRELFEAGDLTNNDALRAEAAAVARATMERVAHNIKLLAERLTSMKYGPEGSFVTPPSPAALAEADKHHGPLPISLHAFYEIVGGVGFDRDLDGIEKSHLALASADPLVVLPIEDATAWLGSPGKGLDADRDPEAPRFLVLAPDRLGKTRASGGSPYTMKLPSRAADAFVLHERHDLPFVAYLRLAMTWGGFPDLERAPRKPRTLLAKLTKDLLPF